MCPLRGLAKEKERGKERRKYPSKEPLKNLSRRDLRHRRKTRDNSVMDAKGAENLKRERLVISANCQGEPMR